MLNPFEAAEKMLHADTVAQMNFEEKLNMFFIDSDMMPLLVQENYITVRNQDKSPLKALDDLAESADYISMGDCVNKMLKEKSAWELLPNIGICGVVAPAVHSAGSFTTIKFPQLLGKNMTIKKASRQIRELNIALAGKVFAPNNSLLNDVVPLLCYQISSRICSQDPVKTKEAIDLMNYFNISLDLFRENVLDLCANDEWARAYGSLQPAAKTAFTRLYNKTHGTVLRRGKKVGSEDLARDRVDPEIEEMKDDVDEEGSDEEGDEVVKEVLKVKKETTKKETIKKETVKNSRKGKSKK